MSIENRIEVKRTPGERPQAFIPLINRTYHLITLCIILYIFGLACWTGLAEMTIYEVCRGE